MAGRRRRLASELEAPGGPPRLLPTSSCAKEGWRDRQLCKTRLRLDAREPRVMVTPPWHLFREASRGITGPRGSLQSERRGGQQAGTPLCLPNGVPLRYGVHGGDRRRGHNIDGLLAAPVCA
ncbi:hypothetical protein E2C01_077620 [Portunus trituberculatus]|uniref:Uncharacterized protein n=1 Tax=Portunus trituberculatus TaxID=210409 RepID=A0A5B7IBV2_PORTR|nr:hypothetical protein [Portunus trituberculatus]